jgi:hypothetical protein
MPTVAEKIRDDIIVQDIRYQRANAGVRREVDDRLSQLAADLTALLYRINPNAAVRAAARRRRMKKLNTESRVLIRTAYSEINGILKSSARRIAKVEARRINEIVRDNLP